MTEHEFKTGESFGEKVQRLRNDMAARGEHISVAAPLLWRLAWRLGFTWKPPLFMGFWTNTLVMGAVWALGMLGLSWIGVPYLSLPVNITAVVVTLVGGACFGMFVAAILRARARRLRLPPWNEY